MGDLVKNSIQSFTSIYGKKFWTDPKAAAQTILDPGHFLIKNKAESPRPKPDAQSVADAATARERERRRLATGGSTTTYSGRRSDALSASIGKRMLGGAA
ncbi:MAG: hypothetical protein EPN91_10105 [Salinibacterium sp.]|nr:MAG: hypothetical protein EPN91_10105 [Salinibacterium sp.]